MNAQHPAVLFIEPRVLDFFRFIAARHLMFVRRVIYRQPPPWTQDPILARTYTTNVYRELDRGTRYLICNILPHASAAPMDTLWNVLVYRMFNLPATYDVLGGFQLANGWNPSWVVEQLESRRAAGVPVFTGAYRVSQRGKEYDGRDWSKIRVIVDKLARTHEQLPALLDTLRRASSLSEAHRVIAGLPGFGGESGFLAYEIVSDLVYEPALLPFSEDDWVNVGPGAKAALRQMLVGPHRDESLFSEAIRILRREQAAYFRAAGVMLSGPELALRNIEHAACEVQKLWHVRDGGSPKRAFTRPNPDLSLWDDIPARFQQRRFPIRTAVNESPEVLR